MTKRLSCSFWQELRWEGRGKCVHMRLHRFYGCLSVHSASRRCHGKTSYMSNKAFITLLHEWVDTGQIHQLEKLVCM